MTPERWKAIDRIFKSAVERTPAERSAFLNEVCDNDEIRFEVESLISAHERTGEFLDSPACQPEHLRPAHDPLVLPGQMIHHYQILGTLGAGSMGQVYLAFDLRLGRRLALKLLPSSFTHDAERVGRFEREAQIALTLNHPNVITIYETGQIDGRLFIATEFIDGETLRQRLNRKRMKLSEALEITMQASSAIAAVHMAGIVHRDIKPENIMLRWDGNIKVLDFGIAKLTESIDSGQGLDMRVIGSRQTEAGVVIGTPAYMSPEQAAGKEVDSRTDIWSLGVVLYEMLTGRLPFEGQSSEQIIVSILEKEAPALGRYVEVPAILELMVAKALAKNIERRYQTAKAVWDDVKRLKRKQYIDNGLQELQIGRKLGRYQVLSLLDAGGMGETYFAEDTQLKRTVVVKVLTAALTQDEERLRCFVQDAGAASSLNHPNVCMIYEIDKTAEGRWFLAMEYIDGQTLGRFMGSGRMSMLTALQIATQVASALEAIHDAGIIHGDLKPVNVMLRTDGLVKVTDCGLANLTKAPFHVDTEIPAKFFPPTERDWLTETAEYMTLVTGTAAHMSPEQVLGQKVDARTDIWSLGVMLYEMTTGKAPFGGITSADVITLILERDPLLLGQHIPDAPSELQRIITKALQKDREERYKGVKDMRLDLTNIQQELERRAGQSDLRLPIQKRLLRALFRLRTP
ncbi:MAG: serine/threonine protein kinase [Pyrinomonadaceae bacterium]|nr:serine/threonine protein kinase [Pyrinomonadaceae bacterium]